MNSNICYTKDSLLCEIMKYDFTADELALFLDTHPYDLKALDMRAAVVDKLNKLRILYNNKFGPLTSDDVMCVDKWSWIESPWPWEN